MANTAWLLGGKGFSAVCGIAYLAILTRSLGLKDFGHFSLIFGTAQALIALAGFETWRVVIRYGAEFVHRKDWNRFGRLAMACGLMDAAGAMLGCVIAFITIYGFATTLALNPAYIDTAFWFSCAMLWALVSTPTGIVRALNRFDKAVYVEAVVPIGRLTAALLIWWLGPTVARYLFAWAFIDLLEAALYWAMARHLCPEAVRWSHMRSWRQTLADNPGLVRFSVMTHAGGTIDALLRQGPLLLVGGLVGTSAAGLYRLANQLTQAMAKLSALLTRSVYAEVAHVKVAASTEVFRRLALQTSSIAAVAGLATTLLAYFLGADLLRLIGGETFARGAGILIPLAVAGSFELASVAFEPVLHSSEGAGRALSARIGGVAVLAAGILLLPGFGAERIAWSVAMGSAASYMALAALAYHRVLRTKNSNTAEATKPA
ncbi:MULTISPECIES: lipopolysaccharide biosynthesis protein [Novosphingobium]|uniref:lipopolysaccharide biosynthesis protein n=1 Tax=Novosphingobium TaxID=165696 RepID=UPI001E6585A8|nr:MULTISPECIES: lipopolysaccharide biosynthesis protein [Novosphingobium]